MNPTSNYGTVLDLRMKHLYPVLQGKVVEEFMPYTNKVTWRQINYMTTGVTGLAMGQIIAEGQVPASDAPIQGFSKVYTQQIFTHRIRLTYRSYYYLFEAKDGAKIDAQMKAQITDLKDAITHLKNYYSQGLLANGFGTSYVFTSLNGGLSGPVTVDTTGADGVAYWSASHPREDGGTAWSNLAFSVTVNPLFNFTSMMAVRGQHSIVKDGRGLPLTGSTLDKLVCLRESQTYFLAVTISKTLSQGKYPSAQVTSSTSGLSLLAPTSLVDASPTESFDVIGLTPYGSLGLTSIMWFMYDSKQVNKDFGFQYIESMEPMITTVYDNLGNGDYVSTITTYCQFGASDLRFWMASNGTAA